MRNFEPTHPHGTVFPPRQWLYQRVWRAQKCIALVGAETVLTIAGLQTTSFHGGQYRAWTGNMRNFGPTYRHDTTFPQEECLY